MPVSLPKALGAAIREQRESKGLSQLELAEKADLHINAVGLFERGARTPSLKTLFELARALDVSVTKLIAAVEKSAR